MRKSYNLLIWSFSQLEGKNSNLGDRAILAATVANIKQMIPEAQITVISSDPQYTNKQYGVAAVYFKNVKGILQAVKQADLVILGGGEFIQDKTSFAYLILNLSIGILALLFKRPISFYAIGVGNRDEISWFGRILSRSVLQRAKVITVRDIDSMKSLNQLGINRPPIYLTADPAVDLPIIDKELQTAVLLKEGIKKGDTPLLCVSVRRVLVNNYGGFLPLGVQAKLGIVPTQSFILNDKIAKEMAQSLDTLIERLGVRILFIPMYIGENFSYHDDDFSKEILKKMNNQNKTKIIQTAYSPEEMQVLIKQADVVISMTLHALILAASKDVPVVAITYSSKAKRFMETIGQEQQMMDVADFGAEELVKKVEFVYLNRAGISQSLENRVKILKEKSVVNTRLVRACLRKYYNSDE